MKIVCLILLVTFCLYGKAEDPKPPAPAAAAPAAATPAAATPAAGTPASGPPAPGALAPAALGAGGLPALPAVPGLTPAAKPLDTGKDTGVGIIGGLEAAKTAVSSFYNTLKGWSNTFIGQA